jgi:hypothetical protein
LSVLKRTGKIAAVAMLAAIAAVPAGAQLCTTQARMTTSTRDALANAALALGTAVKAGDAAAVRTATDAQLAGEFGGIDHAIQATSGELTGDTLRVTQVYVLDASGRKAGDESDAEFSCLLKDTTAEMDFSIHGLPPGVYGFAMVEAAGGNRPWVLALLLRQEGGAWKMAGFYPHARTAAGNDGLWYWNAARARERAKQPWLAWMYYNQADALLQPASFATSTNLDRLRAEEHAAAPPELGNGLSAATPLTVKAADGAAFPVTALASESASDGANLHLVMHYAATPLEGAEANRLRNAAAAKALLQAHPELRQGYSAVVVFADSPGQNPSVLSLPMAEVP